MTIQLAPAGKHVLSAVVQYAPYQLKAGWSEKKAAFTDQLIDLLAAYAPGIRSQSSPHGVTDPRGYRSLNSVSAAVTGTTVSWPWTSS